ncbi:hypothetical protein [Oceanobacillus sp. CFH 90083]|uniref:hypothetical protein n=1 Tax=Oceanobacillus sp. CFH 90083 TaxID=2592336 RepID=UPI00128CC50B|nr:hypothetical protein [Oceanobacillus sp. CFH 90083]
MSDEQWYSNKDLHKIMIEMSKDFTRLRTEMEETRKTINKYNGLREEIAKVQKEIIYMKATGVGRSTTLEVIRNWGGWLFALVTLVVLLLNQ